MNNITTKTKAFNELGYDYAATRGVWSAEREGAILMTLWQREIGWMPGTEGGTLYVDLEEIHPPGSPLREELSNNPRLRTRAERLQKAINDEAIKVDVVVLLGTVGNDGGEAIAWKAHEQDMREWHPVRVDHDTNFFRIEARRTKHT